MRSKTTARVLMVIVAGGVGVNSAAPMSAQGGRDTARSQSESGLILSAEAFCSPTKLRTSNVRLRWSISADARATAKLTSLADAKQTLDTTVYLNGFEKGIYVSLPVAGRVDAPRTPVAPATTQAAQLRRTPPRAFQIRLIESGPTAAKIARDAGEFSAVIEDLEPGVNYKWRLTVEGPSGKLVSDPVEIQAVTCPADMIRRLPGGEVPASKAPLRGGR